MLAFFVGETRDLSIPECEVRSVYEGAKEASFFSGALLDIYSYFDMLPYLEVETVHRRQWQKEYPRQAEYDEVKGRPRTGTAGDRLAALIKRGKGIGRHNCQQA